MGKRNHIFVSNGVQGPVGVTFNERIGQDVDLATIRVNYRWGGPIIAKY